MKFLCQFFSKNSKIFAGVDLRFWKFGKKNSNFKNLWFIKELITANFLNWKKILKMFNNFNFWKTPTLDPYFDKKVTNISVLKFFKKFQISFYIFYLFWVLRLNTFFFNFWKFFKQYFFCTFQNFYEILVFTYFLAKILQYSIFSKFLFLYKYNYSRISETF